MDIRIFKNSYELSCAAADLIAEAIKRKNAVLGLATGASPKETYDRLIEKYNKGEISFKNVTTFNLDEYCAIPRTDKHSYFTYMCESLFNHVDIKEENIHVPDGNPENTEEYCASYDEAIKNAGGIDIQLLGIGRNGHIGFNEPSDSFTKGTYKVKLSDSTVEANKIYFSSNDKMPEYAITMGVESILNAKEIILIAQGKAKAEAVNNMINGEISPSCPASILRKHNAVHIFLDGEAASLL